MDAKQHITTKKADLPPLLKHGDTFKTITKLEVKEMDYQGRPAKVGTLTTDVGLRSTFSTVVIKQLSEFFKEYPGETYDNVRVYWPREKKYPTLEGI